MGRWQNVPFEQLYAEPSKNGLTRPKRVRGKGYKMVNMGEIFAYDRIRNPVMDLVPMNESEKMKYSLKPGDLLFARQSLVAAGAGKCSIVLETPEITTFESHLIRIKLDPKKAVSLFYYYYFSSPAGKGNVQSLVMQVAAAGIRGSELAKLPVPHPPLPIQRKIAAILSAYDDLIENNTRRIERLEEMARSLYREWFVKFRFPGHEQVQMVDSELGPIPEGWEVVCLGKLASFQTGKLNSNAAKPNGVYPFFTCSQEIFRTDTYSFDTECVLLAGNNANGVFHIKYFKGKFDAYQRTYVIRSLNQHQVTNYYLYFAIKAQLEHLKSISTGSATKFLTLTILNNLNIIVSLPEIQDKFAKFIFVVFSEIELLQAKNTNLRKTRDLLLPRLISGEIDVENLDIKTSQIAA
ncbi:restriction endonuclease subunit S [Phormidium nigroviride]